MESTMILDWIEGTHSAARADFGNGRKYSVHHRGDGYRIWVGNDRGLHYFLWPSDDGGYTVRDHRLTLN
jgi:hypothetical protein